MPSSHDVARVFDERAADYDQDPRHRWLARTAAGFLLKEGRLLDLAAGTGLVSRETQLSQPPVLLDISPLMLIVARAALERSHQVLADLHALPFACSTFQQVACVAAEAFMRPDRLFRECHRVLAPDGLLLITAWDPPPPPDVTPVLRLLIECESFTVQQVEQVRWQRRSPEDPADRIALVLAARAVGAEERPTDPTS